jgi:hypothetical protein
LSKEEESTWFTLGEKFLALLLILIGAIIVYAAGTSAGIMLPVIFIAGGLSLIIIGAFVFIAKPK